MAKPTSLFLLVFFSLSLQAQVYRCDSPNGPVYSQMPCAEDAERLADYDPDLAINDESGLEGEQGLQDEPVQKPPTAMENFVATLHTQRQQQLGELDANIARLESQLNAQGEEELDESSRVSINAELARRKSERDSVSEQYTTLISEAEKRASATGGDD